MRQIGEYTLLGTHADSDVAPTLIVMDTNVLIDIHDFYFGTRRRRDGLEDLLTLFPYTRRPSVDINYGWAVGEASWVRGRGYDVTRRRPLAYAAEQVIHWTKEEIGRAFASRHPPVSRDRVWPRVSLAREADMPDPRLFVMPAYGALLYLLDLRGQTARRRSKGPLWAIEQYATWTTDVLGVRISAVTAIAVALLAGDDRSRTEVEGFFALSGSRDPDELAAKAWNVAWDIMFTQLPEGMSYGLLPTKAPQQTVLATRNSDPRVLRRMIDMVAMIDTGETQIPFTRIDHDVKAGVDDEEVARILSLDPGTALSRFARPPEEVARQAARAVQELEVRLGCTVLTSHDGWNL
ncbi:hypothetical protein [Microbacterium sp. NPDC096154]|uniref:hypothetical protein n=1 Tax=Microbacterium sp. NPDC096154 TaxID=3155549 RepID=UPI0033184F2E